MFCQQKISKFLKNRINEVINLLFYIMKPCRDRLVLEYMDYFMVGSIKLAYFIGMLRF